MVLFYRENTTAWRKWNKQLYYRIVQVIRTFTEWSNWNGGRDLPDVFQIGHRNKIAILHAIYGQPRTPIILFIPHMCTRPSSTEQYFNRLLHRWLNSVGHLSISDYFIENFLLVKKYFKKKWHKIFYAGIPHRPWKQV